MFELTAENAAGYLHGRPEVPPDDWRVTALGGGVSNTVLLVEGDRLRFVMKQSLPKLRVEEDWYSRRICRPARCPRSCSKMPATASSP